MENSIDIARLLSGISGNGALMELLGSIINGNRVAPRQSDADQPSHPLSVSTSPNGSYASAVGGSEHARYSEDRSFMGSGVGASSGVGAGGGGGAGGGVGANPELLSLLGGLLSSASQNGQKSGNNAITPGDITSERGEREGSDNPLRKLLGGKTESENRIRLLNALRPYLGEERRGKLELMLKLLKIAELGQLSGLLNSFGN